MANLYKEIAQREQREGSWFERQMIRQDVGDRATGMLVRVRRQDTFEGRVAVLLGEVSRTNAMPEGDTKATMKDAITQACVRGHLRGEIAEVQRRLEVAHLRQRRTNREGK